MRVHPQPDLCPILPRPVEFTPYASDYQLGPATRILTDLPNQANAEYLRDFLAQPSGLPLPIATLDQAGPDCNLVANYQGF